MSAPVGNTDKWQEVQTAAASMATNGGVLRFVNYNGQACTYYISAPVYLTPAGVTPTSASGQGFNVHVVLDPGVTLIGTQNVVINNIIYGYSPLFVLHGDNCSVTGGEGSTIQSYGQPPGQTVGIPSPPRSILLGINWHAGVYQITGDNFTVEGIFFRNYEVGVGVQGENFDYEGTTQAKNIRVCRNHFADYSFGLLAKQFDGCIFDENIDEGSSDRGGNVNPPHLVYITDRGIPPQKNITVSSNISRNSSTASVLKLRNVQGGFVGNNIFNLADRGIQIEYSSNITVGPNVVQNLTPSAQDGNTACVQFVDSHHCQMIGGTYTSTLSTPILSLCTDLRNSQTFTLPAIPGGTTVASNELYLPALQSVYAITATSPYVTGCWLYIVSGSGAGQWNQIANNPAAAIGAAVGVVTMEQTWTTQPLPGSVVHFYDPLCGHHFVSDVQVIVSEASGATNPFLVSAGDFSFFGDCVFHNLTSAEQSFPFFISNSIGTTVYNPMQSAMQPLQSNGYKVVAIEPTSVNTVALVDSRLWPGFALDGGSLQDNGVNSTTNDLAYPSASLRSLDQNVACATNNAYSIGGLGSQLLNACARNFISEDPTLTYSLRMSYDQQIWNGTTEYYFTGIGATGGYVIQMPTSFTVQVGGTTVLTTKPGQLGFFGSNPAVKPTVTGSWSAGTAGTSLAAALAKLGLITNSTTT